MAKKRAFVKYTKSGRIVPGSLIITTNGGYPKGGPHHEVAANLCCGIPVPPIINRIAFPTFISALNAGCLGRSIPATIYLTQECFDNPQIGCEIWSDEAGTTPAVDGDYLTFTRDKGSRPRYMSVVDGVVTAVTQC